MVQMKEEVGLRGCSPVIPARGHAGKGRPLRSQLGDTPGRVDPCDPS